MQRHASFLARRQSHLQQLQQLQQHYQLLAAREDNKDEKPVSDALKTGVPVAIIAGIFLIVLTVVIVIITRRRRRDRQQQETTANKNGRRVSLELDDVDASTGRTVPTRQ